MRSLELLATGLLALWGAPPGFPTPTPVPTPAPTPALPEPAASSVLRLASPGGHIEVAVRAAPDLSYDVSYDGKPLLIDARLVLDVEPTR